MRPSGVIPVLTIPLADSNKPDYDVLDAYVSWVWEQGVQGVCLGMVSEWLRFDDDTRLDVVRAVVDASPNGAWVIVGVGGESTSHAIRRATAAESVGATGVMLLPPITIPLDAEEQESHLAAVIGSVGCPVVVQDASSYVGQQLDIGVQARLVNEWGPDRVLLKPEAHPVGPVMTRISTLTGGRAGIFEGLGGAALVECHSRGATGSMPGGDLPDVLVAMWTLLERGEPERARHLQCRLLGLLAFQQTLDEFVAVEKHVLVRRGIFPSARMMGPGSVRFDDASWREIDARLEDLLKAVDEVLS